MYIGICIAIVAMGTATIADHTAGSGSAVGCDQDFCVANYGVVPPSCSATSPCQFRITYGDGSSTTGFFVTDFLQYDQVSCDGVTIPANASVTFG